MPDRLIPASLYGLTVMRPAYTAEARRSASLMATRDVVDPGQGYTEFITDTDVEVSQDHNYYIGRSPECETEPGHFHLQPPRLCGC